MRAPRAYDVVYLVVAGERGKKGDRREGAYAPIEDVEVRDAVPAEEGPGHGPVEPSSYEEFQASLADSARFQIALTSTSRLRIRSKSAFFPSTFNALTQRTHHRS